MWGSLKTSLTNTNTRDDFPLGRSHRVLKFYYICLNCDQTKAQLYINIHISRFNVFSWFPHLLFKPIHSVNMGSDQVITLCMNTKVHLKTLKLTLKCKHFFPEQSSAFYNTEHQELWWCVWHINLPSQRINDRKELCFSQTGDKIIPVW